MGFKEKRACIRFEIPGATLSYKKTGFFSASFDYDEDYLPILDISRGGLMFLSQNKIKVNTKLHMIIAIPEEKDPMHLDGKVRWTTPNPGFSYKFQIGVQLNPYGIEEGQNSPVFLVRLEMLERKFAEKERE